MNILILTEGGKNIGWGHITRCLSLLQAFDEKGVRPRFLVNADDSVNSIIKSFNGESMNWLKSKSVLSGLLENTDMAIVDSYLAKTQIYKMISRSVKVPVYIDDFNRLAYPPGVIINGSVHSKDLDYPRKKYHKYITGPRYQPLRREFWKVPPKKINKNVNKVLITFGGNNDSRLMKNISLRLGEKYEVNIIDTNKSKMSGREMLGMIIKSDLCITAGGQTTYELARCGTPAIGVCFADNQVYNLDKWSSIGTLAYAGWFNEPDIIDKICLLAESLDYKKRLKMSRQGRKYIDGQGARRIVGRLLSI